jgi:hypothetical protein
MSKDYVIQVEGAYRINDTCVSLDSVVYAWLISNSTSQQPSENRKYNQAPRRMIPG